MREMSEDENIHFEAVQNALKIVKSTTQFSVVAIELLKTYLSTIDTENGFIVLNDDGSDKLKILIDLGDWFPSVEANPEWKELGKRVYNQGFPLYSNSFQATDKGGQRVTNLLITPIMAPHPIGLMGVLGKKDDFTDKDSLYSSIYSNIIAIAYQKSVSGMPESERETRMKIFEEIKNTSSQLAHGLRSPLQTIQNATYLLKMNPKREELLTMINESVRFSTSLLDSFRDYYRGYEIKKGEADINETINQSILAVDIPENIIVEKQLSEISVLSFDVNKMEIVVKNVIQNAVDAMPSGGTLTVESSETLGEVIIKITDTGIGIPPESEGDLFQPFGTHSKGIGLGLATCQRVLEAHNGSISYVSDLNNGTTFILSIPRAEFDG
jgi:signal transduction histidine kinase